MFTKPWMKWDPCTSVSEGWRECSLWLVMIRHTRLAWTTTSSATSFRPATTRRREELTSRPELLLILSVIIYDNTNCPRDVQIKKMSYSVQCAGAAVPQGPAHAQVKLVPLPHDPSHQEEQLKVASIPPAQKHPAASVSQCLLFCLNIIITSVNAWSINPVSKWRECRQVFLTLQLSAVNHLHMCIQIFSSFPAEGSGQSALSTALRGEEGTTLVNCTFQFLKKNTVCYTTLLLCKEIP